MSEANVSNQDASLPEPEGQELSLSALGQDLGDSDGTPSPIPSEEEWVTVTFPNAMSVDAIAAAPDGDRADPALVQLQQQNQALIHRVTELEEALDESRGAYLRQEQARAEAEGRETFLLTQQAQELAASQSRLNQLFQELEASHQTAQRQQILIETLNEQLKGSQERVAQLERECALIQQRHNEQVQLLMQAENTCRDLRTRLERQQRYTLQFKAALERCLEMPATGGGIPKVEEAESLLPEIAPRRRSIQLFVPKAQPVQPWSAPADTSVERLKFASSGMEAQPSNESIVSLPSTEDVLADGPQPVQTVSFSITDSIEDAQPEQAEVSQPDQEAVSPELAQQLQDAMQVLYRSEAFQAVNPEPSAVSDRPMDPELVEDLWDNLARLIETTEATDTGELAGEPLPMAVAAESSLEISENPLSIANPEQLFVDAFVETTAPAASTPDPVEAVDPSETAPVAPPLYSSWPSPVLHPLRSTRKRTSLAAVELPSFPRPGK